MLLIAHRDGAVLSLLVLFTEHTAQKWLLVRKTVRKDVVDDDSECQQTLRHRLAVRPIDGLLGILTEEFKSLLTD